MLKSVIPPPPGVKESWALFTAPVEVSVVEAANRAEAQTPNLCSLPSIMPPASCPASLPVLCSSLAVTRAVEAAQTRTMTETIA
ncbi:hypothetical protein DC60_10305 [Streptomyces wadayamensis]|uniref:Uncharacterized protein n=1 Tax=Streptomyces wadayamensis TaxID=141454 RepID=A0ABR4SF57_9ACTN|nr:hypothetical protein DC60_10305 [Streptomyces wadayamensis]